MEDTGWPVSRARRHAGHIKQTHMLAVRGTRVAILLPVAVEAFALALDPPPCSLRPSRPQAPEGMQPRRAPRGCAAGVEIAQLVAGEAAAVVHAARTWTPADLAQAPAGNITRAPMLDALLPNGRARFVGGALSPRLDAVRCPTLP